MNSDIPEILFKRKIIHIDMDAFYASVEEKHNPRYRGKPLIIGGDPHSRGVVCTASYPARKFGVHSAMPTYTAYKLCPKGIFIRPNFKLYSEESKVIHNIFKKYTQKIQPLSLDEAFLDVTENTMAPNATELANTILNDIYKTTQLTASAGVAPNKMLAKIASDIKKPHGIYVIKPHQVKFFLKDLPIKKIPGVGPVTNEKLKKLGLINCSDIWNYDSEKLIEHFNPRFAKWITIMSKGLDDRPVISSSKRKSISTESTYPKDVIDLDIIKEKMTDLSYKVADLLKRKSSKGKTITIKIKYHDFKTATRSQSLESFINSHESINTIAQMLLTKTLAGEKPVRLIGLGLSNLQNSDLDHSNTTPKKGGWIQPSLFNDEL